MARLFFPETYQDLKFAPWCDGVDPPKGGVHRGADHVCIFIKPEWLPDDMDDVISPGGSTLREALQQLRKIWPHIRPPK